MSKNNKIHFTCLFCLLFSLTTINAQKTKEGVIIIPVKYQNGQWSTNADSIKILPCQPPSVPPPGTEKDPLLKLMGGENKIVYQRHMMNPRFILPEDPVGEYNLLDYVSFNLRLPFKSGVERFEFILDPIQDKEPTVSIDLRKFVSNYINELQEGKKYPCEEFNYVPDQRGKEK